MPDYDKYPKMKVIQACVLTWKHLGKVTEALYDDIAKAIQHKVNAHYIIIIL